MSTSKSGLSTALSAGLFLIDSTKTHDAQAKPSDLKVILVTRLSQYYTHLGLQETPDNSQTLEQLQVTTAKEALSIVEKVQHIIGTEHDGAPSDIPAIGTRDLAELRTLTSIVFKWGVDPLLNHVISSWPSKKNPESRIRSKIIDLTTAPEDYQLLSTLISGLMALLFPNGLQGPLPQTLITATILNRHVADLLRPCLALGWLPKSLASESTPTLDAVRPMAMRLLAILPPSQTIAALGAVLSSASPNPPHVQKSCASLLSRQLLRPEGVTGLCAAIFGEEASTDDAPLEKLEHVARVLTAVPATMKPDEYFNAIIPRIVGLLSDNAPPSHRRAAAFAISRMLTTDGTFSSHALVENILLPILHSPFLRVTPEANSDASRDLTPEAALSTLTTLITNTDPSPTLISTLLSPITSALYALLSHLDHAKTSDPALKESLRGLLTTWGRVSNSKEGINILWAILDGEGGDWKVGIGGHIHRINESEKPPALSFLTPEDLRRADEAEELLDNNFLDLRPDPVHFVRFLKSIDRSDMSSELFVRLLETYRERKSQQESDPMRTLLYLQIIIQIQTQLSGSDASSNILSKPEHILSFVKHALDAANAPAPEVDASSPGRHPRNSSGLRMEDLRLVPEDEVVSDEGDSDDDTPGEELISADDEMTETAINLLLSLLEAHEDLSARTAPILNDIFSLLEPLTNDSAPSIRPLAREARMVMTARLASTSSAARKKSRLSNDEEDPQEIYQKALKLLQDPILPVRAHGLLLLRQLVTPIRSNVNANTEPRAGIDAALVPAILSIFLQSVQVDDSYMFLNAVQGLAAMVDTFGKDVLKGLVNSYTKGLDGLGETSLLTQQDMDTRIRIGEALGQVIRKCGSALGIYVDILVPPLFNVVRSPHVPTTLRTSSLSLLADCEGAHALSLLRYTADLSDAMIDLLQVESKPATASKAPESTPTPTPTLDDQPTSTNSKLPPLRRAAIHLLALLIREAISEVYESESTSTSIFPSGLMKRARTTLAYISSTDEDAVVRVMAREAKEELDHLGQAMMGL